MLSKNELKYIQSLCQKRQRQAEGLFLVEGVKLLDELLQSHYRTRKIYALEGWAQQYQGPHEITVVTETELEKISALQTPNQVLAIVEQQPPKREPQTEKQITLVLDGIQDPGNFGTILRIGDWFGVTQVVASMDTVELYNPKTIQSTMGSFLRVDVWYRSLTEFLAGVKVPVYGALLNGKSIYDGEQVSEGLLVIGNESKGISKELLPYIKHPVTIPAFGGAESLNAAVATGILLSHFRK